MDSSIRALLTSWAWEPGVALSLAITGAAYLRGWRLLRRRGMRRLGAFHAACFLAALATLYVAVASPLDTFGSLLLSIHMVQHLLLMIVAPPLVWAAAPQIPLLAGLPRAIRDDWAVPLMQWRPLRSLGGWLVRPATAWAISVATLWVWHLPQLYDLALRSPFWHYTEHASFFLSSLLFWWPVMRPFPARPRWSTWLLIPYLFLAGIQGTILAALITFTGRVLYTYYRSSPRLWGISPLADQAIAGAVMWVAGSVAYLVALVWVLHEIFAGRRKPPRPRFPTHEQPRLADRALAPLDVLRWPVAGPFLRWPHARQMLQMPLFAAAVVVILDGLLGPQVAPLNLAGVLPWIYWRGLLVLALLVAGNLFCMACPFMLLRKLAAQRFAPRRAWPRWLRGKWPAVALLILFFWAYEVFSLWDHPWRTAWIAIAYFAAALSIDSLFRGAAFCKHVCPIGQFNFVQSLSSPWEIRVRNPRVCRDCTTKDCIRGREGISGCELYLFQPYKAGNMDCTACLDCIHACPYDNVGILATVPLPELIADRTRSGIGRFSRRTDLAALVLVLVFAALANAANMISPVVTLEDRLSETLGLADSRPVVAVALTFELVVAPFAFVLAAAAASRWLSGSTTGLLQTATRFVYALVPLGFGMWLAHYSFHLFAGLGAILPAGTRLAADLGLPVSPSPLTHGMPAAVAGDRLLILEILFLDVGLLATLDVAYRMARSDFPRMGQALRAMLPWAILAVLLFAAGVWVLLQPMQMRGMGVMMHAGGMS